jgi:hypothetical protein
MDNVVTVYHGGSVEEDEFGNVSFVGMQRVPLIFDDRPLFSELFGRARAELHCNSNEDSILVEGLLHYGKSERIFRRLLPIACERDWDKYVKTVMKSDFQCLDLVVRKLSIDPSPLIGHSPPRRFSPVHDIPACTAEAPLPNLEVDVEDVVAPLDAQSAPNEVGTTPVVGTAPQEIPLTQNHPSKCCSNTLQFCYWPLIPFLHLYAILIYGLNAGDIHDNVCGAPGPPSANTETAGWASNSVDVQIADDEEPYGTARAVNSDDDRPTAALSEQDVELIRRFCPERDPLVHEFSDLSHSRSAYAEGRDDELLEAPEAGGSVEIELGMVFKDLPTLRRWLQEYSVKRKRPFKVRHSYVDRRYTVVCEKDDCNWRVCARKQKATGKFKITRIIGPHTCADVELQQMHRQLTSTLIATRLYSLLKCQPNLKVRSIIEMCETVFGYKIKYGKAWRAKQRAWKMIYGDWEEGYEQLPALFNAMKAVNPGMHYEYIPKPNEWRNGRQIFFRAFWCFPQSVQAFRHCRPVFSIDGTFLLGKYMGTMLVAISCDADNALVPLAFALVERENKDSWGWFLRLVRIHVVGPGREVGVISDRHQGILSAVQETIPGYAPLHHRWCTRHLAENLLRKDGTKDNFPLFEEVARMLEVSAFEEKLELLKTATNAEGRRWIQGLLREREKWTRAYDVGGWRYEFQTSNMAESFNSVLKGIRAMPVNAIVSFTFYRLVAWFNERHAHALALQSKNERWAPKPKQHLDKAKERARTHEVHCFDHIIGKYEVTERGGTTADGEPRPSRRYIVVLSDFSCTCGRTRQYHSPCSHYVAASQHRNFNYETKMPGELSVASLVHTWSPRFEPYLDESQWPPYTGPKYIADPSCRWDKRGTRKRTRYKMTMDQVSGRTRRGRATPFLTDPEPNQCGKCGRLGHNARSCHWPLSQVEIICVLYIMTTFFYIHIVLISAFNFFVHYCCIVINFRSFHI